jgi:hypothetical protein
MQRRRKVKVSTFKAIGNDGQNYTLHVVETQIEGADASGADVWTTVGTKIETSSGKIVTHKGPGQYELETPTGVFTLKCDDPNAP